MSCKVANYKTSQKRRVNRNCATFGVFFTESNRLKYRSGSGSRNLILDGSGSRLFKNWGSGSVRVQLHQNIKARFRFNDLKFKRFGFTEKKFFFRDRFDSLLVSDSLNFEKHKECDASQYMSRDFY